MTVRGVIQLSMAYGPLMALWTIAVKWCVWEAINAQDPTLRYQTVTGSAPVMLFCMLFAWWEMSIPTGISFDRIMPLARFVWTLGFITLVIHVLIAFGVAHGWSHEAAVEHVRKVGGFGGGIVVNYLFAAVWLADLIWWWANPVGHANRPRWVGWVVHGFLAFVVVNATVVFGAPIMRDIYAFVLIGTLLWWLGAPALFNQLEIWFGKTTEPGQGPGSRDASASPAGHSPT
jgi:hypothetical protein